MNSEVDAPGRQRTTTERIMDAAEKLIAIYGDSGVSSRAILAEAKIRHNSAVEYHFGSRAGLKNAVWARGSSIVNDRRVVMLGNDGSMTLSRLLLIYMLPFAEYLDDRRPSYWARFNEEALRHLPLVLTEQFKIDTLSYDDTPLLTLAHVFDEIESRTCDGRQPAAGERMSMVVRMVIATFAAWERDRDEVRHSSPAVDLVPRLVQASLAILQAPAGSEPLSRDVLDVKS